MAAAAPIVAVATPRQPQTPPGIAALWRPPPWRSTAPSPVPPLAALPPTKPVLGEGHARFLGWRPQVAGADISAVVGSSAVAALAAGARDAAPMLLGAERRQAVWSDGEDFGRTDGFDLSAWRRQAADHRRRRPRASAEMPRDPPAGASPVCGRSSASSPPYGSSPTPTAAGPKAAAAPAPASLAAAVPPPAPSRTTMLRTAYAGGSTAPLSARSPPSGRLPPLHAAVAAAAAPGSLPTSPVAGATSARRFGAFSQETEFSEASSSQFNTSSFLGYRSGFEGQVAERKRQLAQDALRRRRLTDEAGRRSRLQVRRGNRQRSKGQDGQHFGTEGGDSCSSAGEDTEADEDGSEDVEALRAKRLRRVLARLQPASPRGGGGQARLRWVSAAGRVALAGRTVPARSPRSTELAAMRLRMRKAVLDQIVARQKRARREAKALEKLRMRFLDIPEAERSLITDIFRMHMGEDGHMSLNGCMKCLFECGLRGSNTGERWAITLVVREHMQDMGLGECGADGRYAEEPGPRQEGDDGARPAAPQQGGRISLEAFAVLVLPAARWELCLERMDLHGQWFFSVLRQELSTCITRAELETIIKRQGLDIAWLEPAVSEMLKEHRRQYGRRGKSPPALPPSLAAQASAASALAAISAFGSDAPTPPPAEAAAAEAAPTYRRAASQAPKRGRRRPPSLGRSCSRAALPASSAAGAAPAASAAPGPWAPPSAPPPPTQEEVAARLRAAFDFDDVHTLLLYMEERTDRGRRARERQISTRAELDEEMYLKYRLELIKLYDVFRAFDPFRCGYLSMEEARFALKQLGMRPYHRDVRARMRHECEDLLETDEISFSDLLVLVGKVRKHERENRSGHVDLRAAFKQFTGGRTGTYDPEGLIDCLATMGYCLGTVEQEIALRVIDEFDTEDIGNISFDEFQSLVQRIVESILRQETARFEAAVLMMGLQVIQLADLQDAFDRADVRDARLLTFEQVLKALNKHMVRPPTEEELAEAYDKFAEKTEEINFLCFARLVKALGETRGMHPREAPFTLQRISEDLLREILRCFPIAESYISHIERGTLIENVSNYTGLGASQNLRDLARPIRNARQLLEKIRADERGRRP